MLGYFSNRQTNICLKLLPNCIQVLYIHCIPSVHAVCVCVRACACVGKPLFVLSVGRGLKALVCRVPRRIVEFKKKEADPVSCAVYGVNRRPLVCWDRGFTFH